MRAPPRLLLLACLALGAGSCADDTDEPVTPDTSACAQSKLRYDGFGEEFFGAYCTICHSSTLKGRDRNGAPVGYNWDQIESVREHSAEIDEVAAAGPAEVNDFMPPGQYPAPTVEERLDLGEWLACGAP